MAELVKNSQASADQALDASSQGLLSDVMRIESEFDRVVEVTASERQREKRNWDIYFGVNLSQYTESDKAQAVLEGRSLATFNVVTQKVDSLHGYILKNQFDSDFIPVEAPESLTTRILKSIWLSDKNMMDWEQSYSKLVLGGLIHRAVEEMYIDKRYHPLGNIAFRCHLPGHVIFDPRWLTDSGRDCQVAWVVSNLTASQIMELYPETAANITRIQQDIERKKSIGEFYDSTEEKTVTPEFDVSITMTGINYYRVIRKFEMVTQDVTIEYDSVTGIDLPAGADYAAKLAFLNRTNPKWEPSRIVKRQDKRRVCVVTAVCGMLDKDTPLQKRESEIQIGRLPLFPWSSMQANGMCRGQVDLMADLQMKINYREELITNIIETEAAGAILADPMLFNNEKLLMDAFEQNKNIPHKTVWTSPGAKQRGLEPEPIRKAVLPQDARDQLMRMWDYADRISKSPAVFDARSEKSGESGYLFAQKARVAEQQSYSLFESLKRHQQEKAEAYLEQVKIQYTIAGIQREFSIPTGTTKQTIKLNEKQPVVVDGIPIETVMNDLSSMPRHKVVITESPASTTNRMITRSLSAELLRVLPLDAFGTRQVFTSSMVKSLDTFDAKDQEKLEKFRGLEEKNAELMLEGNRLKMQLGNTQMKMQLDDLEKKLAAQKQMAAAPVPGMSAAGAPPAPSPEPLGGPVAGSEPAPETGAVGSLEGGPVSPEKSAGFQSGGAVTGPAPAAAPIEATPAPGPDGTVPAPAAPGPMPQQQPPKLSDQEIVDQVAQETGGKVSISFTSKPKPQG